jgi:hypothetical protein
LNSKNKWPLKNEQRKMDCDDDDDDDDKIIINVQKVVSKLNELWMCKDVWNLALNFGQFCNERVQINHRFESIAQSRITKEKNQKRV